MKTFKSNNINKFNFNCNAFSKLYEDEFAISDN